MSVPPPPHLAIVTPRLVAAAPERVYRAWTEPRRLARWFAPADDWRVDVHEMDVRVGGRYALDMVEPDGTRHRLAGEYREVAPPERLVFTWRWLDDPPESETVVAVTLRDLGGKTELILTHERFRDEEAKERHAQGWAGCLGRLDAAL